MNLLKINNKYIAIFLIIVEILGWSFVGYFLIKGYYRNERNKHDFKIAKNDCENKEGGYEEINGLDFYYCKKYSDDYGRSCEIDEECKGKCIVENDKKDVRDI